jgi:hypothetical protein
MEWLHAQINMLETKSHMRLQRLGTIKIIVLGLPLGSLERKCHLDATPWKCTKYIIGRKVVASFQV